MSAYICCPKCGYDTLDADTLKCNCGYIEVSQPDEETHIQRNRICELEDEVERLREIVRKYAARLDATNEREADIRSDAKARVRELEAEVERLRGFAKWASEIRWASAALNPILDEVNAAARDILAAPTPGEGE